MSVRLLAFYLSICTSLDAIGLMHETEIADVDPESRNRVHLLETFDQLQGLLQRLKSSIIEGRRKSGMAFPDTSRKSRREQKGTMKRGAGGNSRNEVMDDLTAEQKPVARTKNGPFTYFLLEAMLFFLESPKYLMSTYAKVAQRLAKDRTEALALPLLGNQFHQMTEDIIDYCISAPPDEAREVLYTMYEKFSKRRTRISKDINDLLDYADAMMTKEDKKHIQELVESMKDDSVSMKSNIESFVNKVLIAPTMRLSLGDRNKYIKRISEVIANYRKQLENEVKKPWFVLDIPLSETNKNTVKVKSKNLQFRKEADDSKSTDQSSDDAASYDERIVVKTSNHKLFHHSDDKTSSSDDETRSDEMEDDSYDENDEYKIVDTSGLVPKLEMEWDKKIIGQYQSGRATGPERTDLLQEIEKAWGSFWGAIKDYFKKFKITHD